MVEGAAADASIVRVEERGTYYYHLGGPWLGSLPILSIHYIGTHDNINSTSVAKTMMISSILGTISISYTLSHPNCQCGGDY